MNVYSEKSKSAAVDSIVSRKTSGLKDSRMAHTSDSYQKILDYHVVEIILTTVAFGVIVLLRMHH